ncbi:MAG TPA: hypothetical protein PKA55_15720 [Rhodoblastus sp.]|nr:hypothetical protein [Rhodoblastus sp.]
MAQPSNKIVRLGRLPKYLESYCIYSGTHLPRDARSKEHIIPLSLGGNRLTTIFVSRELNSLFGSVIDGAIEKDPMISFGRRDTCSRGHSGSRSEPEWRNAVLWNPKTSLFSGEGNFTLRFPKGRPIALNNRTREIRDAASAEHAFVIWNMKIDHVARLKFTLKTFLGIGWQLFREEFLEAVDTTCLRKILRCSIQLVEGIGEGGISFTDGFIESTPAARERDDKLARAITRKGLTTVMIRQDGGQLNWSTTCLGYFVGSVWLPQTQPLLAGDLANGDGLLFTFNNRGYSVERVEKHRLL